MTKPYILNKWCQILMKIIYITLRKKDPIGNIIAPAIISSSG